MAKINVTLADGSVVSAASTDEAMRLLVEDRDAAVARAKVAEAGKAASRGVSVRLNALGTNGKPYNGETKPCKGNFSIDGLNAKFPLTFYASQIPVVAGMFPTIAGMILDPGNKGKIEYRTDAERTTAEGWARSIVTPATA